MKNNKFIEKLKDIERYEMISYETYCIACLFSFFKKKRPWYIRLWDKLKGI